MYNICCYTADKEKVWDEFVMNQSVNGTFLQTRRFLNYHPEDRFNDASIMVYDKGKIVAVCPSCCIMEEGKKIFFSHKGSTFGGIVINPKFFCAEKVLEVIRDLEIFLKQLKYDEIVIKNIPELFAKEGSSLLDYCFYNMGYQSYPELNAYIDLETLPANVVGQFDRNKKRNIEKCKKHNLQFRQLENEGEIEQFYKLLKKNLEKYNLKPIHTVNEIKEFYNSRLRDETRFYGVFKEDEQVAGGMMFVFKQANVIHAQNLSADYTFSEYSSITYLYYKVIEQAKLDGYSKLTWGISTEEHGKYLNRSLIKNKESYGSKYALNYTYYKDIL